jgi:hypothetical protein
MHRFRRFPTDMQLKTLFLQLYASESAQHLHNERHIILSEPLNQHLTFCKYSGLISIIQLASEPAGEVNLIQAIKLLHCHLASKLRCLANPVQELCHCSACRHSNSRKETQRRPNCKDG